MVEERSLDRIADETMATHPSESVTDSRAKLAVPDNPAYASSAHWEAVAAHALVLAERLAAGEEWEKLAQEAGSLQRYADWTGCRGKYKNVGVFLTTFAANASALADAKLAVKYTDPRPKTMNDIRLSYTIQEKSGEGNCLNAVDYWESSEFPEASAWRRLRDKILFEWQPKLWYEFWWRLVDVMDKRHVTEEQLWAMLPEEVLEKLVEDYEPQAPDAQELIEASEKQHIAVPLADDGIDDPTDGSAKVTWHNPDESPPSEFQFGPLTGEKKQLASWTMSRNTRNLNTKVRNGTYWGRVDLRTQSSIWFKDQKRYAEANSRKLAEEQRGATEAR